jgi:hypothetical protein
MSDTETIQFLADTMGITFEEAEQRSARSNALFEASEGLQDATNELMKAITFRLEGREDDDGRWQKARPRFAAAVDQFDAAKTEAIVYLFGHGSRVPDDQHPESVWDAQVETDEEGLADAASALIQGTITRREFEQRRAAVLASRAKLDAAVDSALGVTQGD